MAIQPLVCLDPQRSDRDGVMTSIQFQPWNVALNGWRDRSVSGAEKAHFLFNVRVESGV